MYRFIILSDNHRLPLTVYLLILLTFPTLPTAHTRGGVEAVSDDGDWSDA